MTSVRRFAALAAGFKTRRLRYTLHSKLEDEAPTAEGAQLTGSLAGGGQLSCRYSFCARLQYKRTASVSGACLAQACDPRGGRSESTESHETMPTISTPIAIDGRTARGPHNPRSAGTPERFFFSFDAADLLRVGGSPGTPLQARQSLATPFSPHSLQRVQGGGLGTPTHTSHHVGVSGGVGDTRLTPCWCEGGEGVACHA